MKEQFISKYQKCDFCGKMISSMKLPIKKIIDQTEINFCTEDCIKFYRWYQKEIKKVNS